MKIVVSGKHIDVGESLKSYIEENVANHVKKHFDQVISVNVSLSKQKHVFKADIMVNDSTGKGIVIRSQGSDGDAYKSVDEAITKMDKQLVRYQKKIKNHKHKRMKEEVADMININATKYVISPHNEDEAECFDNNPAIIAEKSAEIEKLSISDAVMKMDLSNLPAMMFINANNSRINMVYYRPDGNIAWVDVPVNAGK